MATDCFRGCRSETEESEKEVSEVREAARGGGGLGQRRELPQQGAPCIESHMTDLHIKMSDFEIEV